MTKMNCTLTLPKPVEGQRLVVRTIKNRRWWQFWKPRVLINMVAPGIVAKSSRVGHWRSSTMASTGE